MLLNKENTSEKHLSRANDKAEDLTIKRLTAGSPALAEKFKEVGYAVG